MGGGSGTDQTNILEYGRLKIKMGSSNYEGNDWTEGNGGVDLHWKEEFGNHVFNKERSIVEGFVEIDDKKGQVLEFFGMFMEDQEAQDEKSDKYYVENEININLDVKDVGEMSGDKNE